MFLYFPEWRFFLPGRAGIRNMFSCSKIRNTSSTCVSLACINLYAHILLRHCQRLQHPYATGVGAEIDRLDWRLGGAANREIDFGFGCGCVACVRACEAVCERVGRRVPQG